MQTALTISCLRAPPTQPPADTPVIIANLLAGTALSSKSSVAAGAGNKSLLPVALAIVPYSLASIFAFVVAASSQRRDEQFWHVSSMLLSAGVVLALFPPLAKAAVPAGFLSLSFSLALAAAANGPATALVSRLCKGPEHVVALPLFSSFSVIGGIIGPLLTGALMGRLVRPLRGDRLGLARARPPARCALPHGALIPPHLPPHYSPTSRAASRGSQL